MYNRFMQMAIDEANKTKEDVPIGAVIVRNGEVIAKAHNMKEIDKDVTSHAEILAIKQASKNDWRLCDCDIYVTLEPCPMCAWAILQARFNAVYFGSYNLRYGALLSAIQLSEISDHKPKIYGGIMEESCDTLISTFWQTSRFLEKSEAKTFTYLPR